MLKRRFSSMIAAMAAIAMVGTGTVTAYGENEVKYPVMPEIKEEVQIDRVGNDETPLQGTASLTKYDPRGSKVSGIRNQGSYGTCWVFSSVAAMESNLIKKKLAPKSVDLSENQLLYYFYHAGTDKLGYTKGDKNVCLDNYLMVGGIPISLGLSTMTGMGVTTEKVSPYLSTPKKNICYSGAYDVNEVHYYDYSIATTKKAISKYGAVVCAMYMDTGYFDDTTNAYYCYNNMNTTNHGVTIVGWDDNYSRYNFGTSYALPSSNGAWIVKNSYGTSFGDNGYMYMSYEDKNITSLCTFDMIKASQNYDNYYQHDGSSGMWYFNISAGDSVANVYTAKGSKSGCCEVLKAVSLCSYTENVRYSLQVYTGITNSSDPTSGTPMFSKPQTGKLSEAGYSKVKLKKAVTLANGEKFAVVVKFLDQCKFAVETGYTNVYVKYVANIGKKKSFWRSDYFNIWTDIGYEDAIARIKAYTDESSKKVSYKINKTSVRLKAGKKYKLRISANPSGAKRNVVWTSTNKSVAVVSKNGYVTGKNKGRTTISAKFSAGNKIKTLKCNVKVN